MYFLAVILGAKLLCPARAKLRRAGTEPLIGGKAIVSPDGHQLGDGSLTITSDEVVLHKANRQEKVDLRSVEKGWFEDDVRWGGHYQANRLRHIAFGGNGGFYTYISDFAAVGPGKALAILSLTEAAKIQGPQAQILVALSASPLRMRWIRLLSGMGDGMSVEPAHRLYRFKKHLYLNDANQISRIESIGRVTKRESGWSCSSKSWCPLVTEIHPGSEVLYDPKPK